MKIGIDIGSTTIKCVVLDDNNQIIHKSYERHLAMITEKTQEVIEGLIQKFDIKEPVVCAISGSAGMGLAERAGIPFVQEVYATKVAIEKRLPETDVVIELGGEDAKILFMQGNLEVRMNGTCAGGTGAFADQMASLMQVSTDEMNELAKGHKKIYSIASRCGVFAKTDIQPLLNQGARKEDISASIFSAIVNQTITGLAQGRPITGNIVYLGGPLTFMSELRKQFDETLNCEGICPEDSLYFVALGAAYYAEETVDLQNAWEKIGEKKDFVSDSSIRPLFENQEEYDAFVERHAKNHVPRREGDPYCGKTYLGIDSGSTTLKIVLMDAKGSILFSSYESNQGKPIEVVRETLLRMYEQYPDVQIVASAVTGYGEEMMKTALGVDIGVVETVAHYTAARYFMPDVEFIIDIGGQDMKCFKIRNGVIDNIFLNEACSSGCGSFLQTFASSLGYSIDEFAKLGLFGKHPVDLGSRCTVFMNSSVKQAQKEGVTVEDISAGLSMSVVKNALYKVIRVHSAEELGKKIVVQGGTFLNDAVLRAFERELDVEVIRPDIAGMMGAYGAALYAKQVKRKLEIKESGILSKEELENFTYEVKGVTCKGCNNHCQLTINEFGNGKRFLSGNRCEKPVTHKKDEHGLDVYDLDIYKHKLQGIEPYEPDKPVRGVVGIPAVLNMYDMFIFWCRFFEKLGYRVVSSGLSNRELYLKGQGTIPSDTVCFPAKLVHGHIQKLIELGVDIIFYPCMTFNFDEKKGDNHYNCAVVSGYPEVIEANTPNFGKIIYIDDYLGPHVRREFPKKMQKLLEERLGVTFTMKQIKHACAAGYYAYEGYRAHIRNVGLSIIRIARMQGKKIIVIVGRPYHADPEINHGITKLLISMGFVVISEDVLSPVIPKAKMNVLNQWTYHARMFCAARYVIEQPDMYLVHLVSFGCGLDAVTSDEIRSVMEEAGQIYTQIKIDEVTNLGAVKIRLRSLLAAIEQEEQNKQEEEG